MLYALDSWPFADGVHGAEHMDFLQQQGAQARDAAYPAAVLATWSVHCMSDLLSGVLTMIVVWLCIDGRI